MRIFLYCVMVIFACFAGFFAGVEIATDRFEATCNDENAATRIQGVDYICLPPAAWPELYKQLQSLRA